MQAHKKTLMAVKNYIENQNNWELGELVAQIVEDTKILRQNDEHILTEECFVISYDDTEICNLNDFLESYTEKFIERFCYVLDSFVGDSIDLYLKE